LAVAFSISSNSAVNVPRERKCRLRRERNDKFRSNPEGGKSTSGEPDAVKVARPVRRREWGNVSKDKRALLLSYLNYLISIRDSAKSGLGFIDNRHLNYFAESINGNVGGFYQNAKVSSPPKTDGSVGAVVVVGGWESQPHGKGR
jgi:hypothetical protein